MFITVHYIQTLSKLVTVSYAVYIIKQMKSTILIFFSLLVFYTKCTSQATVIDNLSDMEQINSIFDKVEVQGVDTKQNLLYGYFFFDKDKLKLEALKGNLLQQSYKFVELAPRSKGQFILHVEKVETLTRQELYNEEQALRKLASKYKVGTYDGFDVGNPDPKKPITSNEIFFKFMNSKKGNDLFGLGMQLYTLAINDKAVIVFKECIKQNIKADTASFKLGNVLLTLNKNDEGIKQLEQATIYNPKYVGAFFNLGAACYDNMKFQKSIEYYQQADKLKPNDDNIIYGIAASQFATQQYNESWENCKKALVINNQNANAKQLLVMLKGKTK